MLQRVDNAKAKTRESPPKMRAAECSHCCFLCHARYAYNPVYYFLTLQLSSEDAFYFDEDGMVGQHRT